LTCGFSVGPSTGAATASACSPKSVGKMLANAAATVDALGQTL
jgi:hypothetical protein